MFFLIFGKILEKFLENGMLFLIFSGIVIGCVYVFIKYLFKKIVIVFNF